jgi:hypothetical protein
MTDVTADTHVNGTAPTQADEPCTDCATPAEKGLAVLAAVLGAFIIILAIDMFTGGRITGQVTQAVQEATQ